MALDVSPPPSLVDGQRPPPTESGYLRKLLLDTGVGSKWVPRDLARGGVGHMTWYRLIADPKGEKPYLCEWDALLVIAKTLQNLGARITLEQIQQAWLLDKGNYRSSGYDTLRSGAAQADAMVGVIASLPPTTQVQLMETLMATLPHHDQLKLLQSLAGLVAGGPAVGKRERERDDDDGSGLRP